MVSIILIKDLTLILQMEYPDVLGSNCFSIQLLMSLSIIYIQVKNTDQKLFVLMACVSHKILIFLKLVYIFVEKELVTISVSQVLR